MRFRLVILLAASAVAGMCLSSCDRTSTEESAICEVISASRLAVRQFDQALESGWAGDRAAFDRAESDAAAWVEEARRHLSSMDKERSYPVARVQGVVNLLGGKVVTDPLLWPIDALDMAAWRGDADAVTNELDAVTAEVGRIPGGACANP